MSTSQPASVHFNKGRRHPPRSPGFPLGVLVDPQDAAAFGGHSWSISGNGYVQRHAHKPEGGYTKVRLHREIMGFPDEEVDHINGDRLDNRRGNLRVVDRQGNGQNTGHRPHSSRYLGVSWNAKAGKWYAHAKIDGRMISLGFYAEEADAGRVALEFRQTHYAGFAGRGSA